ncbi:hypothetical protein GMSM_39370 [Geomonas sp. Red276]
MQSCKSCGEEMAGNGNFCPKCGCGLSDDTVTIRLTKRAFHNLKLYSLVSIGAGLSLMFLGMSSPALGAAVPLMSSFLIMGGLVVFVLARFGAWWQ